MGENSAMADELRKLGHTLDGLVDLLFSDIPATRERAEHLIREMLWDNKIGIIRTLQGKQ